MAFYITDIRFTNEFTGDAVEGTTYPNTGVMSKVIAEIDGYFYLAFTDLALTFNNAEKSITNVNELDFRSFKDDGNAIGKGLEAGRTISIEDSNENNFTVTVASISEDGRTIYIVEDSLVNEVDTEGVSIFDDTPIEAMDFSYNLIENNEQENYLSKTDKGAIQRFTVDGIDSENDTPVNMMVSSSSFGWVTNELTDPITGETDEVTVEGVPVTS